MAVNSRNGNSVLDTGVLPPVRAATTAAIVLSGLQTVDGVVLLAGDRVLVKDQADPITNGLYAASTGSWVRTADTASNAQLFDGIAVLVAPGGAMNGGQLYICTTVDDPVVIGTSAITFGRQSDLIAAGLQATSATPQTVGTGAMSFAIATGKSFVAKQWVLIYSRSDTTKLMLAQIQTYAGGALGVNVVAIGGAGTASDWTIVLTNSAAAAGLMPPIGTGNVTGPGVSVAGNLPRFADTTGKLLEDSGKPAGTLAGRNTLLYGDAGAKSIAAAALADGAAPLQAIAAQPNDNLVLTNDGLNPTRDMQLSPGRVRDASDVTNLQIAATLVKRLDLPFAPGGAAGAPAGMLDTGSTKLASKTYHAYLIGRLGLAVTSRSRSANVATLTIAGHALGVGGTLRSLGVGAGYDAVAAITGVTAGTVSYANAGPDEGATAVAGAVADGFDMLASQQDVNAYPTPVLPAGWTVSQCLGSVLTDASANITPIVQIADEFFLVTPVNSLSGVSLGIARFNRTMYVPIGLPVLAIFSAAIQSFGQAVPVYALYSTPGAADIVPTLNNCDLAAPQAGFGGTNLLGSVAGEFRRWSSSTAQIGVRLDTTNVNIFAGLMSRGWRDPRRRLF